MFLRYVDVIDVKYFVNLDHLCHSVPRILNIPKIYHLSIMFSKNKLELELGSSTNFMVFNLHFEFHLLLPPPGVLIHILSFWGYLGVGSHFTP